MPPKKTCYRGPKGPWPTPAAQESIPIHRFLLGGMLSLGLWAQKLAANLLAYPGGPNDPRVQKEGRWLLCNRNWWPPQTQILHPPLLASL
jgi:hypothetical protein